VKKSTLSNALLSLSRAKEELEHCEKNQITLANLGLRKGSQKKNLSEVKLKASEEDILYDKKQRQVKSFFADVKESADNVNQHIKNIEDAHYLNLMEKYGFSSSANTSLADGRALNEVDERMLKRQALVILLFAS